MNAKQIGIIAATVALSGCYATPPEPLANTVEFNGEHFKTDKDGSVVMSAEQFAALQAKPGLVKGQNQVKLELTETEFDLVKDESEVILTLSGNPNPDSGVNTLIRQGSLQDNLNRVASENGWNIIVEGVDQLVEAPFVLKEESVETAVLTVVEELNYYACFDAETQEVVLIEADLDALYAQAGAKRLADSEQSTD